jgi:hypothetical protein
MDAELVQIPASTVDEFVDAQKAREAFAPTERRYQKLYSELKQLLASADPAAEYTAKGERYTLRISPCSVERKVDVVRAKKKLGVAAFLECCTVSLKALGNFLATPDVDALTIASQTGSRSYTAVPVVEVSEQ